MTGIERALYRSLCWLGYVELEGFEPSSKRGTSVLSTCLFWPSLSGGTKTQTTKSLRIL